MIPNLLLLLFLDGDWQRSQPIRRELHHLHAMLFSRPSDYRQKLKCMLSYKHLSLRRIQIFSTFPRWMPFILWPAPRDFVCCFMGQIYAFASRKKWMCKVSTKQLHWKHGLDATYMQHQQNDLKNQSTHVKSIFRNFSVRKRKHPIYMYPGIFLPCLFASHEFVSFVCFFLLWTKF